MEVVYVRIMVPNFKNLSSYESLFSHLAFLCTVILAQTRVIITLLLFSLLFTTEKGFSKSYLHITT